MFAVRTPECTHSGLGSAGFARRYSRYRCFFLFLRLLRCFSSPGSLRTAMYLLYSDWSLSSRVSPFRHSRINGYLLLPVTFRSLSRLSSALSAKASTLRSFLLDLYVSLVASSSTFLLSLDSGKIARSFHKIVSYGLFTFLSFYFSISLSFGLFGCLDI